MTRNQTALTICGLTLAALPMFWSWQPLRAGGAKGGAKAPPVTAKNIAETQKSIDQANAALAAAKNKAKKAKDELDARSGAWQKLKEEVARLRSQLESTQNPVTKKGIQVALDKAVNAMTNAEKALAPFTNVKNQADQAVKQAQQKIPELKRRLDEQLANAITRTVSNATRSLLDAAADASHAKEAAARKTKYDAALKALEKELKPYHDAYQQALEKQQQYPEFQKHLAALGITDKNVSGKLVQSRAENLATLMKQYPKMSAEAYRTAGIDEAKLTAIVARHFGKDTKHVGQGTFRVPATNMKMKALVVAGKPLTQPQRNQLYPLLGSQNPAMTPALRAALANGLRDDLDRKAKVPSQADVSSLVPLLNPEAKLAPPERDAMQRLLAGSRLHETHRQTLFGLLHTDTPGGVGSGTGSEPTTPVAGDDMPPSTTADEKGTEPDPKTADDEGKSPKASSDPTTKKFTRRYLMLENATKDALTVYVLYETLNDRDEWTWLPGPAEDESKALKMELGPEEIANFMDGDTAISARRVHLWALSAAGAQWLDYKTQDLLLIPEEDDQGERWYGAAGLDTFTFTFSRN